MKGCLKLVVDEHKDDDGGGDVDDIIWVFPKIGVPPKSSILIGFSLINHPFWGTTIFGNTHILQNMKVNMITMTKQYDD